MRILIHDLAYTIEKYDEGDFHDTLEYIQNIINIIQCFREIDDVVLFPIEEEFLANDEDYIVNRDFINDRIVFKNNEWIFNIPKPYRGIPNMIWFKAEDRTELTEVIKDDLYFNCVIVRANESIDKAKYILNSSEDEDFNSLIIREKNKGDFLFKVFPKLQSYLGEKLEVIDLRSN